MKLSSVSSSCSSSSESRPGAGSSRCPLFKDHSLMAMSSAVMCTDCANQLLKKVPSMGNEVERPDGWENQSRCVITLSGSPRQPTHPGKSPCSVYPSHQCHQIAGPDIVPAHQGDQPQDWLCKLWRRVEWKGNGEFQSGKSREATRGRCVFTGCPSSGSEGSTCQRRLPETGWPGSVSALGPILTEVHCDRD